MRGGVWTLFAVENDCLGARAQVDIDDEDRGGFFREVDDISDGVGDTRDLVSARGLSIREGRGAGLAIFDDRLVVRWREANVEPHTEVEKAGDADTIGPDTERVVSTDAMDNLLDDRRKASDEPETTRREGGCLGVRNLPLADPLTDRLEYSLAFLL